MYSKVTQKFHINGKVGEAFHNSCMRRMMGRYRGTGGPSTAELLDVTGLMPISQLLSRHRVR